VVHQSHKFPRTEKLFVPTARVLRSWARFGMGAINVRFYVLVAADFWGVYKVETVGGERVVFLLRHIVRSYLC
jgi:hypothetical protein